MAKKPKRNSEDVRKANAENRGPPRRTINKEDAIRHLLHASIRLFFAEEDPFAIALLVHSADKLLLGLAKNRGISGIGPGDFILPEKAVEFWSMYRETYNYFKHADLDAGEELGVHDIVAVNELGIFFNIVNSHRMGLHVDRHAHVFLAYITAYRPDIETLLSRHLEPDVLGTLARFTNFTRAEMMDRMREMLAEDQRVAEEKRLDLQDVHEAGQKRAKGS